MDKITEYLQKHELEAGLDYMLLGGKIINLSLKEEQVKEVKDKLGDEYDIKVVYTSPTSGYSSLEVTKK